MNIVERIRIDITADGRVDLTGNTSRVFPNGLEWVRASDYDALLALCRESERANRLLLSTVNDLLKWKANIGAFTEPAEQ